MSYRDEFVDFLIRAKLNGYANPEAQSPKQADGGWELFYEDPKLGFAYRDRYYGFNPFSGQEVILRKDPSSGQQEVVWTMVYYGSAWCTIESDVCPMIPPWNFLREALRQANPEAFFRGPQRFTKGELVYENTWEGDRTNFHGEEHIFRVIGSWKEQVYIGRYLGGGVGYML
jgi:hypothetical protein